MPTEPGPRRPYVRAAAITTAVVLATGGTLAWLNRDHIPPAPAPSSPATAAASPTPQWSASSPAVPADVRVSWAYLDSTDGSSRIGGDDDPHALDMLVVPGIAQDYLEQRGDKATDADRSAVAAALSGDPEAGGMLIVRAGGIKPAFERIIEVCSLARTKADPPQATTLDIARYAACLREGAITTPNRAADLLDKMRGQAGGIADVRGNDGGQRLAQFNATVPLEDGRSRTRCMGIGAYWSAAVLVNFPTDRGALFGTETCAQVARAEFPPDTQPAPESGSPAPVPSD